MRTLFFSDLRVGSTQDWFPTLRRICSLAREMNVDAVCSGGNLFDGEPNDGAVDLVAQEFLSLGGIKVLLAPGRTDWWHPNSPYQRLSGANVHVFTESDLSPVEVTSDVTIWGAAHRSSLENNFLDRFDGAPDEGTHVALIHGFLRDDAEIGEGRPSAAFSARDVEEAGLTHVLAGQLAAPGYSAVHTCPGWASSGVMLVSVGPSGAVTHEWRPFGAPPRIAPSTVDALPAWVGEILDERGPVDPGALADLPVWVWFATDVADNAAAADRPRVLRAAVLAMGGLLGDGEA